MQTKQSHPIHVILDNIRSLYNVGSIFRTADAAGIEKIHICGTTGYPPNARIEKTALGATKTVPWAYYPDAVALARNLQVNGLIIAALEITGDSVPYTNIKTDQFPIALIVGNEINGVDRNLLDLCDISLEIPQFGVKESLNAAVAFGVVTFELVRIWRLNKNIIN